MLDSWEKTLNSLDVIETIKMPMSGICLNDLIPAFDIADRLDTKVEEIYLDSKSYAPIRAGGREFLNIISKKSRKGLIAFEFADTEIIVNRHIPKGNILFILEGNKAVLIKIFGDEFFNNMNVGDSEKLRVWLDGIS